MYDKLIWDIRPLFISPLGNSNKNVQLVDFLLFFIDIHHYTLSHEHSPYFHSSLMDLTIQEWNKRRKVQIILLNKRNVTSGCYRILFGFEYFTYIYWMIIFNGILRWHFYFRIIVSGPNRANFRFRDLRHI